MGQNSVPPTSPALAAPTALLFVLALSFLLVTMRMMALQPAHLDSAGCGAYLSTMWTYPNAYAGICVHNQEPPPSMQER